MLIGARTRPKVRRFAMGDDTDANGWDAEPHQLGLYGLCPITRQHPIPPLSTDDAGVAMYDDIVGASCREPSGQKRGKLTCMSRRDGRFTKRKQ